MSPDRTEYLINTREALRETITPAYTNLKQANFPSWWHEGARTVCAIEQGLDSLPAEVSQFMQPRVALAKRMLRDAIAQTGASPVQAAENYIMELSRTMASEFQPSLEPMAEHVVPLDDFVAQHHEVVDRSCETINGTDFDMLRIHPHCSNNTVTIPIPRHVGIWHKGGAARLCANIIAGAPTSMINSEIPVNDFDIISTEDEGYAREIANTMGVDHDGVEIIDNGPLLDFPKYAHGRDTTQNQVCIGYDGVHVSDAALQAARTGHVQVVGEYMDNKAIYGKDTVVLHGVPLVRARGLMRLIKPVAEGKALSFDYRPLNAELDFGVYWLFLARKWSKRDNFGDLMQRMFELGKRMEQVYPGEEDIYATLTRVHKTYPFFDMNKRLETLEGLVEWKLGKLLKQVDREFGWFAGVPCGLDLHITPDSVKPRRIDLAGFSASDTQSHAITAQWQPFMEQCRTITGNYYRRQVSDQDKLFTHQDIEDPTN